MADLKRKGDLAELMVAADLVRQGYQVAFPFGEDCDFDLLVLRGEDIERVQVKHTRSDGKTVIVKCRSHSLTNGRVRAVKHYTAEMIEWLAVYDATTGRCFYIPASELGQGKHMIHLRLVPPSYNRRADVRFADDYVSVAASIR